MPKTKKRIQKVWLRKLFHLHIALTAIALGAYLLVALFDPGFLSYDLRQKFHALADDTVTITATVLGPPEQPVVTGNAVCDGNTGTLSVVLDWGDDQNTYTYDIERDSLSLVTGLTASGYIDLNVVVGTTYEYIVTARGPMGPGFATSLPVDITTPSECVITAAAPTVRIVSFGGRGVDSYDGTPRVSDRRPVFSGTTNIPNATIQVVVGAPSTMIAEVTANSNGYWSWKPPAGLSSGIQLFTVTAIDPLDNTRQASASLTFGIKKKNDDGSKAGKDKAPSVGESGGLGVVPSVPAEFSLTVENHDKKVWQGEPLNLFLLIETLAEQYDDRTLPVRYSVVDDDGNVTVSFTQEELLHKGREIREHFPIPLYMATGEYDLQAEIIFDQTNVSRTDAFAVTEAPFIQLGGGAFITYAEIVRNLGWIVLALSILLLLWLFMFLREYGMYLQALRHITERQLQRAGFLTKRKGVVR